MFKCIKILYAHALCRVRGFAVQSLHWEGATSEQMKAEVPLQAKRAINDLLPRLHEYCEVVCRNEDSWRAELERAHCQSMTEVAATLIRRFGAQIVRSYGGGNTNGEVGLSGYQVGCAIAELVRPDNETGRRIVLGMVEYALDTMGVDFRVGDVRLHAIHLVNLPEDEKALAIARLRNSPGSVFIVNGVKPIGASESASS